MKATLHAAGNYSLASGAGCQTVMNAQGMLRETGGLDLLFEI